MALGSQIQVLTQASLDPGRVARRRRERAARRFARELWRTRARDALARGKRVYADRIALLQRHAEVRDARKFLGTGTAGKRLAGAPSGSQGNRAELDGGKRQRPGASVGPKENARAGRRRGVRHSGRHAHGFARRERQDRRDENRRCAGEWPRHRGISIARCALRLHTMRSAHRFGGHVSRGRRKPFRCRAIRSAQSALRLRCRRLAFAALFPVGPRFGGGVCLCAGHGQRWRGDEPATLEICVRCPLGSHLGTRAF